MSWYSSRFSFPKIFPSSSNEFLKNEIIDNERDLEYWIEVFCKEVKEEEFNNYCNECFNENEDVKATERSIINDIQKM